MLRRVPHVLALLALALGAMGADVHGPRLHSDEGPLPSMTGAPGVAGGAAENDCTLCHQDYANPCDPIPCNLNTAGGGVEILDLPSDWQPGLIYPLRVRLWTDSTLAYPTRRWGFEITALHAIGGTGAGQWVQTEPDTYYVVAGSPPFDSRSYAEPTYAGVREGLAGPVEWSLQWQAPVSSEGDVLFFVAAVAGDGDDQPGPRDFVFTANDTMLQGGDAVRAIRWGALKARYR